MSLVGRIDALNRRVNQLESENGVLRRVANAVADWSAHGRYGPQCAVCHGSRDGSYGYVKAGHREGCALAEFERMRD